MASRSVHVHRLWIMLAVILFTLQLGATLGWSHDPTEEKYDDDDDDELELEDVTVLNLTLSAQCMAKIIGINTSTQKYLGEVEVENLLDVPVRVSTLCEKLKMLTKQLTNVQRILAKSASRSEGAELFERLHNQAAQIQSEYENVTKINGVTNPGFVADLAEPVLSRHDPNTKVDVRDLAQGYKKDLSDCVALLERQHLFPKRAKRLDAEITKSAKGWPTLDRQTLVDYLVLLNEVSEANIQRQDTLRRPNPVVEKEAYAKLHDLIVNQIPAFLKKHGRMLSSVLPVLTLRLDNVKPPSPTYDLAVEFEDQLRKHVEMLRILEAEGKSEALEAAYEEFQRAKKRAVAEFTKHFEREDGGDGGVEKLQVRQRHEL